MLDGWIRGLVRWITYIYIYIYINIVESALECLRFVSSLRLLVSFAKEPYKRDYILQKSTIILRSLLIVARGGGMGLSALNGCCMGGCGVVLVEYMLVVDWVC